jgi:hypothetical protein
VTVLFPAFLLAAGLVAAAVVAIHFIVTAEPRTVPLPTARFAPVRPVRTRARRLRLQDLLLMALRVLAILAVGAGLAQPMVEPPRRELARILLVDRSRAVADPAEVADSARALFREGDAVVLFDSTATRVRTGALDSLATLARSPARGRLSAALIVALRTASEMRERADSFELAIISAFAAEEADLATDSIRALWPGGVRLVRVAARADSAAPVAVAFDGEPDDPLRFALVNPRSANDTASSDVLVVRGTPDGADSAWAASGARALVHWPATHMRADDAAAPAVPPPWTAREAPDSIGGLAAGDAVIVAPFERWAAYDEGAAARAAGDGAGRVVARWVDGEPAAIEVPHGAGCIRTVMVGVPSRGDLVLQPRFARLAAVLTARCGGPVQPGTLDSARLASLAGEPATWHAAGSALPRPEVIRSTLAPWLFAAALAFALAALVMQRRVARHARASGAGRDA